VDMDMDIFRLVGWLRLAGGRGVSCRAAPAPAGGDGTGRAAVSADSGGKRRRALLTAGGAAALRLVLMAMGEQG